MLLPQFEILCEIKPTFTEYERLLECLFSHAVSDISLLIQILLSSLYIAHSSCYTYAFLISLILPWNIFKLTLKHTGIRTEIWTQTKTHISSFFNNSLSISLSDVSVLSCFNICDQFINMNFSCIVGEWGALSGQNQNYHCFLFSLNHHLDVVVRWFGCLWIYFVEIHL